MRLMATFVGIEGWSWDGGSCGASPGRTAAGTAWAGEGVLGWGRGTPGASVLPPGPAPPPPLPPPLAAPVTAGNPPPGPGTSALSGGTGDTRSSSRTTNSYSPLVDVCLLTPETRATENQ